MQLRPLPVLDAPDAESFKRDFYEPQLPCIIRNSKHIQIAREKWNWAYFKSIVGEQQVGVYNNVKSDAYTPINKADGYMKFGEYLDLVKKGPVELRIFLFNIFQHAPQLTSDFTWPDEYMKGFVKKYPMLFVGGAGSITHMHFDIDLSHILHTQFAGKKRVLLFPFTEQYKLYRKPFEVLCLADFSHYSSADKSKLNYENYPAVKLARGFEGVLEHGDTLFMPGGYWHHMEYLESGFAMSLRALNPSLAKKLKGLWNIAAMRNIDTLFKKTMPHTWYGWKERKSKAAGARELQPG
jgi:hypothetical protein